MTNKRTGGSGGGTSGGACTQQWWKVPEEQYLVIVCGGLIDEDVKARSVDIGPMRCIEEQGSKLGPWSL